MARVIGFVHSGADQSQYKAYNNQRVEGISFEHPTKVSHIEKKIIVIMTYKDDIVAAITELKERNGSSAIAIKKLMQSKMTKDKKWINYTFLMALKTGVANGDFIQLKNSYKLSPDFKKASTAKPKAKAVVAKKKVAAPKKATAPKKKTTAAKKATAPKKKTTAPKKAAVAKKVSAPKKEKTTTVPKKKVTAPKKEKVAPKKKATAPKKAAAPKKEKAAPKKKAASKTDAPAPAEEAKN